MYKLIEIKSIPYDVKLRYLSELLEIRTISKNWKKNWIWDDRLEFARSEQYLIFKFWGIDVKPLTSKTYLMIIILSGIASRSVKTTHGLTKYYFHKSEKWCISFAFNSIDSISFKKTKYTMIPPLWLYILMYLIMIDVRKILELVLCWDYIPLKTWDI